MKQGTNAQVYFPKQTVNKNIFYSSFDNNVLGKTERLWKNDFKNVCFCIR